VVKTYVLRISPEDAKNYESTLDELEESLEEQDIGEVTATFKMGGMEVVLFIDLLSDLDKPRLIKLLKELKLREVTRLEEAKEADDDDWGDDDDDDDWDGDDDADDDDLVGSDDDDDNDDDDDDDEIWLEDVEEEPEE